VTARLHCWATLTPDTVQDKAVHGHILALDTHINFSVEEDYGEKLEEMTSISLVEQAPVGQAHLSGSGSM
jgi:hypothetical protein